MLDKLKITLGLCILTLFLSGCLKRNSLGPTTAINVHVSQMQLNHLFDGGAYLLAYSRDTNEQLVYDLSSNSTLDFDNGEWDFKFFGLSEYIVAEADIYCDNTISMKLEGGEVEVNVRLTQDRCDANSFSLIMNYLLPRPPSSVNHNQSSENTLDIIWEPAPSKLTQIEEYHIRVNLDGELIAFYEVPPYAYQYTLTDLIPGAYTFEVLASTNRGNGQPKVFNYIIEEVTPAPDPVNEPDNIYLTSPPEYITGECSDLFSVTLKNEYDEPYIVSEDYSLNINVLHDHLTFFSDSTCMNQLDASNIFIPENSAETEFYISIASNIAQNDEPFIIEDATLGAFFPETTVISAIDEILFFLDPAITEVGTCQPFWINSYRNGEEESLIEDVELYLNTSPAELEIFTDENCAGAQADPFITMPAGTGSIQLYFYTEYAENSELQLSDLSDYFDDSLALDIVHGPPSYMNLMSDFSGTYYLNETLPSIEIMIFDMYDNPISDEYVRVEMLTGAPSGFLEQEGSEEIALNGFVEFSVLSISGDTHAGGEDAYQLRFSSISNETVYIDTSPFSITACNPASTPFGNSNLAGVDGTVSAPYMVCSPSHFLSISNYINSHVTLKGNVDFIGHGTFTEPIIETFSGTLDGNGFSVKNITLEYHTPEDIGVINHLSWGATIKNVVFSQIYMENEFGGAGAIVGWNDGTIQNCTVVDPRIFGEVGVGGVVALNDEDGLIIDSEVLFETNGEIKAFDEGAGGVAGWNDGTIENSFNNVPIESAYDAGGLVGYNDLGTITRSWSTANVQASMFAGGLVGMNDGLVQKSYHRDGTIETTGGGMSVAGGLIGWNDLGTLEKSYAHNTVFSPNSGGLVGESEEATSSIINSMWVDETNPLLSASALGLGSNTGVVEAITEADLCNPPSFEIAGWDFDPTTGWVMPDSDCLGPEHWWQH